MDQFNKEIPKRNSKEQMIEIIRIHKMNLSDMENLVKTNITGKALECNFLTLKSDIEIMNHILKKWDILKNVD